MPHVDCPICGKDGAIYVRFGWERQGDGPMAGSVELVEEVEVDCDCGLSDSQYEDVIEEAAKANLD